MTATTIHSSRPSARQLALRAWQSPLCRLASNLAVVYLLYFICRVVFIWENSNMFPDSIKPASLRTLFAGGLRFDTSAIFYTNSLWLLLYLLPLHKKDTWKAYRLTTKLVFVVINAVCMLINLADTVFFSTRGHRTTMAIFQEFGGEGNIGSIVGTELVSHWYLVVLLAVMTAALWLLYRPDRPAQGKLWKYYVGRSLLLAFAGLAAVCGMRGNIFFLSATRPISTNYAFRYTRQPVETGIVLNTPFSLIRTIGQTTIPTPTYFSSEAELDAIYSPLHLPADSAQMKKKNVVIFILESFDLEFVGAFNRDLDNGTYKGYTPWIDSMVDSCMYFDQMIANTFYSIDAPPAILASIPRADRPYVVSPHAVNHINSIASTLKDWGYSSAFFHGGDNESLGFNAFTRQAGFEQYFGMNEFVADKRFGGRSEFDGYWGIWDEPFLQYFCAELGEMKQPFVASVFTLSSHHPFKVPEKYKNRFVDEGQFPLHKCVRYADYALQRFFEEARKQPWFYNTIFVLSADHASSKTTHEIYKTPLGDLRIPILFYDPSGELPRGRQEGISQQIDIMPTLLSHLGYDRPFVAFGKDLLNTPADSTWAFNWNDVPTYLQGDYMLQFDGENVMHLYNYRLDPMLTNDLKGTGLKEEADMTMRVKAIVQSYLQRMNADNVTAGNTSTTSPSAQ